MKKTFFVVFQVLATIVVAIYGLVLVSLYIPVWLADALFRIFSKVMWRVKQFMRRRLAIFKTSDSEVKKQPKYVKLSGNVRVKLQAEHKGILVDDRNIK